MGHSRPIGGVLGMSAYPLKSTGSLRSTERRNGPISDS